MPTSPKTIKPVGRPSEYNQDSADAMCSLLAFGWSLRRVIEEGEQFYKKEMGADVHFPATATVFKWMRDNEEFLKQYTRAKQESADAMAEEVLDISDDGKNDWMEKRSGDNVSWIVNGEAVQRSKLRVETRKWLMAKMKPKRYGDKLDLTSGGDKIEQAPLVVSTIRSRKQDDNDADAKPKAS